MQPTACWTWPRQLLLLLLCSSARAGDDTTPEPVCAAGTDGCTAGSGSSLPPAYYWPMQKGSLSREGFSPFAAPSKLEVGPSWTWAEPYGDVLRSTPLIDDRLNIYLSTIAGRIYKFSPGGELLWQAEVNEPVPGVPSIFNGSLFLQTRTSFVISLDMETGKERWRVKPIELPIGFDTTCNLVIDGLLVFAINGTDSGNAQVAAVHTVDGSFAWSFLPEANVYNFQPSSPGDGTIVFQDQVGGVYRLNATDGSLMWRSGCVEAHTTTTAAAVVHAGMVLVASNYPKSAMDNPGSPINPIELFIPGALVAYNLSNGHKLWYSLLPYMANQAVAVGPLGEGQAPAAVIGFGENPGTPIAMRCLERRWPLWLCKMVSRVEVVVPWIFASPKLAAMRAINVTNGEVLWHFELDPHRKAATAGDSERFWARVEDHMTGKNGNNDPFCLPDSSSQPVIGGDGTAYQVWQDGKVYAVRDANADGEITRSVEVSTYNLGDGAQGSVGLAPGMMALAPCGGGLYVFKNAAADARAA